MMAGRQTGFGLALVALGVLGISVPSIADAPGAGGTMVEKPVTGEQIYRQICQACHLADGKGGAGAGKFPALANNPRMAVAAYPISVVTRGKGAMPWFSNMLNPEQVAAVVGYVRTNFGNNYPAPVTEADVKQFGAPPPKPEE